MDRGAWPGYSLWDHKELDTTERLTHTHTSVGGASIRITVHVPLEKKETESVTRLLHS